MRVFLTGATGYVGNAVARCLAGAGHELVALVRSAERGERLHGLAAELVVGVGGLQTPEAYRDAAAKCEAVVHLALEYTADGHERPEVDRTAIEALIATARAAAKPRHLVYTSNAFLLPSGPSPVNEDTPLPSAHGEWRLEHERRVLESAGGPLTCAVVRLGYVYGGAGGTIWDLFAPTEEGSVLYAEDGGNRWPFVHVEDLAELYRLILEKRASGVFHGVDGAPLTVREVAATIARCVGAPGGAKSIPVELAERRFGGFSRILARDLSVRAPRSRALGWSPRHRSFTESAGAAYEERRRVTGSLDPT